MKARDGQPVRTAGALARSPLHRAAFPHGVVLAVITLALGIGSCQLPQPHLPKLSVASTGGATAVAAAAPGAATPAPVGRT